MLFFANSPVNRRAERAQDRGGPRLDRGEPPLAATRCRSGATRVQNAPASRPRGPRGEMDITQASGAWGRGSIPLGGSSDHRGPQALDSQPFLRIKEFLHLAGSAWMRSG